MQDVAVESEAGGFLLETADTVVQSYALPKPTHIMDPSSGKNESIKDDETDTFDNNRMGEFMSGRMEEENIDEEMEDVRPAEPMRAPIMAGVPKTMQELAEAPDAFEPEEIPEEKKAVAAPQKPPPRITRGGRQTRQTNGSKVTPEPKSKLKPKQTAGRGRKRARSISGGEEEEASETEEDEGVTPKRSKAKVVSTPAPSTSTRTLRSRQPKSEEKKRQERELEMAFRRAIAE